MLDLTFYIYLIREIVYMFTRKKKLMKKEKKTDEVVYLATIL